MTTRRDAKTSRKTVSAYEWTQEALDELPLWTLVRAFHPVAATLYELFARHELTPTQFGVLAQLATGAADSQAQLARRVLVTPQSLHVLVAELEGRGLLEISGGLRGRGRRQHLTLTTAGWTLIDLVRPELHRLNAPANVGLGKGASRQLNESLHALRRHLEAGDH